MNALKALGYMTDEKKITAIRLVVNGKPVKMISKEVLEKGLQGLHIPPHMILADTWELGWECDACWGTGEVWSDKYEREVQCSKCDGAGVDWKKEY